MESFGSPPWNAMRARQLCDLAHGADVTVVRYISRAITCTADQTSRSRHDKATDYVQGTNRSEARPLESWRGALGRP